LPERWLRGRYRDPRSRADRVARILTDDPDLFPRVALAAGISPAVVTRRSRCGGHAGGLSPSGGARRCVAGGVRLAGGALRLLLRRGHLLAVLQFAAHGDHGYVGDFTPCRLLARRAGGR